MLLFDFFVVCGDFGFGFKNKRFERIFRRSILQSTYLVVLTLISHDVLGWIRV